MKRIDKIASSFYHFWMLNERRPRIIYSNQPGRLVYFLVSVPSDLKFELDYKQPSSRTDLQLGAIMEQEDAKKPVDWYVRGLLDPYNYELLGLPTARGSIVSLEGEVQPPLITDESLSLAGKFGDLREIKTGTVGMELYRVSLRLNPRLISAFLNRIWQPDTKLVVSEDKLIPLVGRKIPDIIVDAAKGSRRILPVKYEPKVSSSLPRLTLTVG